MPPHFCEKKRKTLSHMNFPGLSQPSTFIGSWIFSGCLDCTFRASLHFKQQNNWLDRSSWLEKWSGKHLLGIVTPQEGLHIKWSYCSWKTLSLLSNSNLDFAEQFRKWRIKKAQCFYIFILWNRTRHRRDSFILSTPKFTVMICFGFCHYAYTTV